MLDNININSLYYLCIASKQGQILINSEKIPIRIDLNAIVQEVALLFRKLEKTIQQPNDIILTYTDEKVYVQKIPFNLNSENFLLLIAVLPINCLYFKRAIKKNMKQIEFFLT